MMNRTVAEDLPDQVMICPKSLPLPQRRVVQQRLMHPAVILVRHPHPLGNVWNAVKGWWANHFLRSISNWTYVMPAGE
jgi:hypothetical protein